MGKCLSSRSLEQNNCKGAVTGSESGDIHHFLLQAHRVEYESGTRKQLDLSLGFVIVASAIHRTAIDQANSNICDAHNICRYTNGHNPNTQTGTLVGKSLLMSEHGWCVLHPLVLTKYCRAKTWRTLWALSQVSFTVALWGIKMRFEIMVTVPQQNHGSQCEYKHNLFSLWLYSKKKPA